MEQYTQFDVKSIIYKALVHLDCPMDDPKVDDFVNEIIRGYKPPSSNSVEQAGPWKYEVHHIQHLEDADEYATISDGKVTLYIDGGQDDDDEQRLCNLLNQLKIKLDYDHGAELLCSQLEQLNKEYGEEITRLRREVGLRWVKGEPPERKLYFAKFMGNLSDEIYSGVIEPVPNPEFWQAIASGCRTSIRDNRIIEFLDELASPASTKEGDINDAMIDAVYEGAEMWKQEYDDCRMILQELVTLKMVKDTEGKTPEYQERQPLAWKTAIEFLNVYQHLGE